MSSDFQFILSWVWDVVSSLWSWVIFSVLAVTLFGYLLGKHN